MGIDIGGHGYRPAASIRFENWGVVCPGFKTGGSRVLKVQKKEVHSTGFRVSSPEIFI